jgi:hypothetical protein
MAHERNKKKNNAPLNACEMGHLGFFDTEYLNGKGAQQGKQWAIESM